MMKKIPTWAAVLVIAGLALMLGVSGVLALREAVAESDRMNDNHRQFNKDVLGDPASSWRFR